MKATKALFLITLLVTTCQDWNYQRVSFLEVSTEEATEITANTVVLHGTIDGLREGATVSQHGHVWSAATDAPTLEDMEGSTTLGREGNRPFTSDVGSLRANTRYYFRSYAVFREETIYGEVSAFTTENFSLAIQANGGISVDGSCATVNWSVFSFLGAPEKLGVVWSATNENPTIDDPSSRLTEQSSPFLNCTTPCPIMDDLCDLEPNTNFYARAYLVPGGGQPPVYSEVVYFHTFLGQVGWQRLQDFEVPSWGISFVFTIDERAFLGSATDIWEYTPEEDSWMIKTTVPIPYPYPVNFFGFSIGSTAYIGGGTIKSSSSTNGSTEVPSTKFWSYDLPTDKWDSRPELPERLTSITGYNAGKIISIGNRAYWLLAGELLEFNPEKNDATQWQSRETLSFSGGFFAAIGGKGYLLGNSVWEFDPAAPPNQNFTRKDNFPGPAPGVSFIIDGKAYAGLGVDADNMSVGGLKFSLKFWEFDPSAPPGQQWRRMPDFIGPGRNGEGSFSLNDKGYIVGGGSSEFSSGGKLLNDVWQFIPPE